MADIQQGFDRQLTILIGDRYSIHRWVSDDGDIYAWTISAPDGRLVLRIEHAREGDGIRLGLTGIEEEARPDGGQVLHLQPASPPWVYEPGESVPESVWDTIAWYLGLGDHARQEAE